ncbi:MAG TPA: hypothetical protein DCF63_08125 [Planctomycetaceae bacterium]|nr:hypothetical protein [Planctomycetaceae bacterium]
MNWNHVHLIFKREMMDQLRDRRTLFTITVLPLLLYPLLGMLLMQVAQFHQDSPVRITIVGNQHWPEELPIIGKDGLLVLKHVSAEDRRLLEFQLVSWPELATDEVQSEARKLLDSKRADAVLVIQQEFPKHLGVGHQGNEEQSVKSVQVAVDNQAVSVAAHQGLLLLTNLTRDQSMIAQSRITRIIDNWWTQWRTRQMLSAGLPAVLSTPIHLETKDTSASSVRQAVRWSKILPFIMLIWALTGAFYPAIDLCAGEKERGTLETLLSSPARRREIVWGKLLTINAFSIGSAVLNLMSMQLTTGLVVRSLASSGSSKIADAFGAMPLHSLGWLLLLLLPMSAFFSACSLAVAALAKSTKEGQYYLMPLLLITLPLVGLPMIPSMELNLGTSMIPVSGAVFLVRSLIEGRIGEAMVYLPVVFLVTLLC